jgi:RNA polymerase sigma-70 factor (ECF subfamily)
MSSETVYFPDLSYANPKHREESTREESSASTERTICTGTDEELLNEVGLGSKAALAHLFRRHHRIVLNVAWRILRDRAEAEDLRQEIFLLLFQKAKMFDAAKGTATSWILQITHRRAIDRKRYLAFREHYDALPLNEQLVESKHQQLFVDEIYARTMLSELQQHLSADQQQTFELHFSEGYSLREIAEKTNQTLGNIRNHYYRGLERLRSIVFPQKDA